MKAAKADMEVSKATKKAKKADKMSDKADGAATDAAMMPKKRSKKMTMTAAGMSKMTYRCPKGDALSDAPGKCPKCGTEMEMIKSSTTVAPKMKKTKMMAKPVDAGMNADHKM
jgi:rubrerythrin